MGSENQRRPLSQNSHRAELAKGGASQATAPRRLAHEILTRVFRDDAFADRLLLSHLGRSSLEARDKALVTELVYGTLRHHRLIDFYLAHLLSGSLDDLPAAAQVAMALGAYQILYTRIPEHSAVDQSVALAGSKPFRGVVNAVLRKLIRLMQSDALPIPEEAFSDLKQALAVRWSMAIWIVAQAFDCLGKEEALQWLAAQAQIPAVTARVAAQASDAHRKAWEALGAEPVLGVSQDIGMLAFKASGAVESIPGFLSGEISVQDPAACLAGLFVDTDRKGEILDLCAAPGGKTVQWAAALSQPESWILANDVQPGRLGLVRKAVAQKPFESRVHFSSVDGCDGERLEEALHKAGSKDGLADQVVVDAPCLGLGTLRRHPELRWRDEESLQRLVALQRALLQAAALRVRPGGFLVYMLCSWTPAEGYEQVDAFLAAHPDFTLVEPPCAHKTVFGDSLQPFAGKASGWMLQTWTHKEGHDGFFAVRMQRKA